VALKMENRVPNNREQRSPPWHAKDSDATTRKKRSRGLESDDIDGNQQLCSGSEHLWFQNIRRASTHSQTSRSVRHTHWHSISHAAVPDVARPNLNKSYKLRNRSTYQAAISLSQLSHSSRSESAPRSRLVSSPAACAGPRLRQPSGSIDRLRFGRAETCRIACQRGVAGRRCVWV
jgi:hypothetical protein